MTSIEKEVKNVGKKLSNQAQTKFENNSLTIFVTHTLSFSSSFRMSLFACQL